MGDVWDQLSGLRASQGGYDILCIQVFLRSNSCIVPSGTTLLISTIKELDLCVAAELSGDT